MNLYERQKLLVRYLTDKKFKNSLNDLNSKERSFLKEFDHNSLEMFITLHDAKRKLRFSTLLKRSYSFITENNMSILYDFFEEVPYRGQRSFEDIIMFKEFLLDFYEKNMKIELLTELVCHESIIYGISIGRKKYDIQQYQMLDELLTLDGTYIYFKNNSHQLVMKKISCCIYNYINEYSLFTKETKDYIYLNDTELYNMIWGEYYES